MKWTSLAAAAFLFALAHAADAATPGFYVTAAAGSSTQDPKSIGINFGDLQGNIIHANPDRIEVDDGGVAWGAGLGYRINDYLSGEIEYVDFGTTDVHEHYTAPILGPIPLPPGDFVASYSSKVTGPAVSLVGTMPVGKSFELFVRGGVLFASREHQITGALVLNGANDQKFADTVWLAGVGASWSFAKRWGVRAEYQQTGTLQKTLLIGSTRVKRVALSAIYRF